MPEEDAQDKTAEQSDHKTNKNGKNGFRPNWLSDTILVYVCGAVGTIAGGLGAALLNSHPKPFLAAWGLICFGSISFGISVGFWLMGHRKRQGVHKMPKWAPRMVSISIGLIGVFVFLYAVQHERPDLGEVIEGTKTTLADMDDAFPFGYIIFTIRDGVQTRLFRPESHLHWKVMDWEQIKISPDFANNTVEWTVPHISASLITNGTTVQLLEDCKIGPQRVPMVLGKAFPLGGIVMMKETQPNIYVAMIGNNQRQPVFAMGFRIGGKTSGSN